MKECYGYELILDLHECNTKFFTRKGIADFFEDLCKLIDMQAEDLHFWDYEGDPEGYRVAPAHLKGISAVQFIKTSNMTIHTLDVLKRVYLNIFSCKYFSRSVVEDFAAAYFEGRTVKATFIRRV